MVFSLNICLANTNPLTDKSKHIYHPQNRDELVELLKDESIKLDSIDTSAITDMSFLFANMFDYWCDEFAPHMQTCKNTAGKQKDFSGIETWDVSNVTNMSGMFDDARLFKQNLDSWKVNKDTDTNKMFNYSPLESNPPKWYKQ